MIRKMNAEGKPCFRCGKLITKEDLKEIVYWVNTTDNETGLKTIERISFPDNDKVVCYQCLRDAQLEVYEELFSLEMNKTKNYRLYSDQEDEIINAEIKRKLPYIQFIIGSEPIDPELRWLLENMDCFGDYEADNDVCSGGCLLAKGCEKYTKNHGL